MVRCFGGVQRDDVTLGAYDGDVDPTGSVFDAAVDDSPETLVAGVR